MGRGMDYALVADALMWVMEVVCRCDPSPAGSGGANGSRAPSRCPGCPVAEGSAALRRLFATDPTFEPKEMLEAILRARDEEEEASEARVSAVCGGRV